MTRLTRNSYIKIGLVCLLCLAICTSLIGNALFMGNMIGSWNPLNDKGWTSDPNVSTGTFDIEASAVDDMSINWLAGKVDIKVVDDAETDGMIQVKETLRNAPELRWRHADGRLEIDYGNVAGFFGCSLFQTNRKDLEILIPESHADKFNAIELSAASGEYVMKDIGCKRLELDQMSGSIQATGFKVDDLALSMASGAASFDGEVHRALKVEQASGNATIRLNSSNPKTAELSMSSGEMRLMLPEPDFYLELDKVSGNFSSDYDLLSRNSTYYSNSGELDSSDPAITVSMESKITMSMMSGNFFIGKTE